MFIGRAPLYIHYKLDSFGKVVRYYKHYELLVNMSGLHRQQKGRIADPPLKDIEIGEILLSKRHFDEGLDVGGEFGE